MRRFLLAALAVLGLAGPAAAASPAPHPFIPDLFDPRHRVVVPPTTSVKSIRFLTTDDFPPFHFALADGTLAGFDIDLARAVCADLKLACTIQARRFETVLPQIEQGKDDAAIAAIADTPATRKVVAFTAPYYTTPARFVALAPEAKGDATPEAFAGQTIGVVAGTAHEAYLAAFFKRAKLKPFPNRAALLAALKAKQIRLAFADAIGLALWLNSPDAGGCCAFRGGPFTESHYFGNGVSIAVAKDNAALREALDLELSNLSQNGTYADLYLKWFPIGFY
jgi:polar amino acid transport system substrate-binding protein